MPQTEVIAVRHFKIANQTPQVAAFPGWSYSIFTTLRKRGCLEDSIKNRQRKGLSRLGRIP